MRIKWSITNRGDIAVLTLLGLYRILGRFTCLFFALLFIFLFVFWSPAVVWSGTVTVLPTDLAVYNTGISTGGVDDIKDDDDGTWMTVLPGDGTGDNGQICGIGSFSDPGITDKEIEEIRIFFRYDTDTEYSGQTYPYVGYSTANPTGFPDSSWFYTTIPSTAAQTTTTTVSDTIDKTIVGWGQLPNLDVAFMNSDAGTGHNVRIYDIWIQITYDDTPPAAITDLSAVPGTKGGDIDLSWTAPGDDGWDGMISSGTYRIKHSTDSAYSWDYNDYDIAISTSNVYPGNSQYHTVTGLDEGTSYYFRIWTADDANNWSEISNGATSWAKDIPPAAITNLSASPGEIDRKIKLSWSAPGDDGNSGILTGEYIIDYATYTKTWSPTYSHISISTSNVNPGDNQYWAVLDLTVGATYYFRIWTRDEVPNHWSEISNGATTWAPAISPGAVTDLEATPSGTEGSINLIWTAPAEDGTIGGKVSSYILKYATFTVTDTGGNTNVWWNHPQTLTWLDGGSPQEPGKTETFSIGELSPGKRYYFALKSRDDLGSISPIDTKTASLNQANTIAASIPPADITDLVAEPGGYDRMDLSWTAPGDDGWVGTATKYIIRYATYIINAGNFEAVPDVKERSVTVSGGSSDSESVTGLMAYTTYYFAIKTEDEIGNVSGISNIVSAETGKDSLPPGEPVGIRGILSTDGEKMTISWRGVTENEDGTACKDLKGYNVYRAPIVDGDYVLMGFVAGGEALVWTDPENVKGRTLYYNVKAKDTSGNLSRASMIVDSSVDMNIIFVSNEDRSTRIVIPKEIRQILFQETNSYGEDVIMEILREKEKDERVIKSFSFTARGEQSGREIKDFVFVRPLAKIVLAYEVENGYVKKTSSVPEDRASEQLALFWFNGLEWIKLGGDVDEYFHLVSVTSKRIGKYMIKVSFGATSFRIESIQPDKIFTPNGDSWNDYLEIHYANPRDAFVSGKIYDLKGALVAEMENRADAETLIWDGKDTNGHTVPGGVYIYQIEVVGGENKVVNGTVVVAR